MDRIAASIKAAAMEAARGYDLSERAYDRLFSQLIALETALGSAAAEHVDEALQIAVMRETRLLDDPLEGLLKSGACIQQMAGVFIPPSDDLGITTPAASGEKGERNRYADRTRQVVGLLRAIGVHADDLVVYSSARPKGMFRARPYTLIEIPRLQKQIAVADAVGEATFVASKPLSLETWSASTKPQLVGQHGVHRLIHDQDGKWLAELHHLLVGDLPHVDPALHAKVPLLEALPFARLTEGMIVRWVSLFHEKEGRFPSGADGEVWERAENEGWIAVEGLNWDIVDAALRYGRRGLQGGSTLARLKKEHGLIHDRAITSQQLATWVEAFHQKEGRHATTRDSIVWELRDGVWGAVKGENWNALNQALLKGVRGLSAYKGMTLPQFRWAVTDTAPPFDLSPEMIVAWMQLFHEKEGRYPFETDATVWERDDAGVWTQREDIDWINIHRNIRCGGRGLKESLSPAEFRQRYLGTVERAPRSQEDITEWIKVFYEKEGRLPSPSKDKEVWRRLGDELEIVPNETW